MISDGGRSSAPVIADWEFNAFVDGELSPDRELEVRAHLADHPRDRARVEAYARQVGFLREMREQMIRQEAAEPPRALDAALVEALRPPARSRWNQHLLTGAIAAGLGCLIFAGGLLLGAQNGPGPVASHSLPEFPFGGAMATLTGTVPPMDGEKPVHWLQGKLAVGDLRLPDFKAYGLRPIGGAVIEGAAAPAIRLVWVDEENNRLSLYAAMVTSGAQQAFTLVPEGRVSIHWRSGDIVYALVTPTDSRRLLDVVRAVAQDWSSEAPLGRKQTAPESTVRADDTPAVTVKPVLLPKQPDPAVVGPDTITPAANSKPAETAKPL